MGNPVPTAVFAERVDWFVISACSVESGETECFLLFVHQEMIFPGGPVCRRMCEVVMFQIDPGWLFVVMSGVAGLFFLFRVRQDIVRGKTTPRPR